MEMVVVVILVGVIYALILTYMKPKREYTSLGITSPLRAVVLPFWNHTHLFMICKHKCQKCTIYDDNNSILSKDIPFPLNSRVKNIYSFDDSSGLQNKEFFTKTLNNEKICLRYDIYPNKSSSELFIEDKNGSIFYFPPYFNTFKNFTSLQSAKDYFDDIKIGLSR